jgi:putative ABC transport system substrate-binding protein
MRPYLRRREFIAGLGGAVTAWPLVARAQQQTKPTIGWLYDRPGGSARDVIDSFRRGLAEIGFLEGRDVTVEYHTTAGHPEQRSALVADLVRRRVAVIFAEGGNMALAAKTATRAIPIPVVFAMGGDPVELGLVASLNRPGGNLTGVVGRGAELAGKRLELLYKLAPTIESIAMLVGRTTAATTACSTSS